MITRAVAGEGVARWPWGGGVSPADPHRILGTRSTPRWRAACPSV